MRKKKNNNGSILIVVLFAIALLTAFVGGMLQMNVEQLQLMKNVANVQADVTVDTGSYVIRIDKYRINE